MPVARNTGQFGKPTYNQAFKVARRFGGEAHLAKLIGVSRISVYRWQYRRPYGSDGLIPAFQIEKIKAIARTEGILIRPEDWLAEKNKWDVADKPKRPTPARQQAQPEPSAPNYPTLADLLG